MALRCGIIRAVEPSLNEDEWLWGWDPTPGIVSVWAEATGRAVVWRRIPETGALVREEARFRPWVVLDSVDGLPADVVVRELDGPGELRYFVTAADGRAIPSGVRERAVLALSPEEQYLVSTGRTYFRDLAFDQLRRMQFDLETTGLTPEDNRIFMIAVREPSGACSVLEGDEAYVIRRLVECVRAADPDVIENHNLQGFDLPFLEHRARVLGVPLALGRMPGMALRERPSRRKRMRFVAPGRELIDTLDAVMRYDFAARDLPDHGLKSVARHFGLATEDREYIQGDRIFGVYQRDPERVRRYATSDVQEVAGVARMLGGAAFALARMAPRRYERLADAGAATGVIDPLLVRAYLRMGKALPAHRDGDGTPHSGAALHLFASGVARRIVKADVASLYPSLMRAYRIGPARDHMGVLLALVDRLVERRLAAKAAARAAAAGSDERFTQEALSAAMKLVVNTAYGYLAAGDGLTRFADVHAANEVTRRGRETLGLMCRELAARGVTLLEADTDGVYFSVPESWTEADERRVVSEVDALLPPLVHLEFDGRYAAMLSHEPKNYALLTYGGELLLRGVAFRSSRAEPFGEAFLRRAIGRLLAGDIVGVREAYCETLDLLRRRELPTFAVSSRVRLTKGPERYLETREARRELAYEALLACGRTAWSVGDKVRVYRTQSGAGGVVDEDVADKRDYDVERYARLLRDTFVSRLARAFTAEDFGVVFAEPGQMSLFGKDVGAVRAVLMRVGEFGG
jgi:DNA polymerase elongation subunit (family B)